MSKYKRNKRNKVLATQFLLKPGGTSYSPEGFAVPTLPVVPTKHDRNKKKHMTMFKPEQDD